MLISLLLKDRTKIGKILNLPETSTSLDVKNLFAAFLSDYVSETFWASL